jgi:hypothetical protein
MNAPSTWEGRSGRDLQLNENERHKKYNLIAYVLLCVCRILTFNRMQESEYILEVCILSSQKVYYDRCKWYTVTG